MKQESWGRRIWRLLYPGLTYFGICFIVEAAAAVWIAFTTVSRYDIGTLSSQINQIVNEMLQRTLSIALELQVIAAALTLPVLILYYRMDRKREAAAGQARSYQKARPWQFLPVIVLGMTACLAGNNLIMASGLYQVSESYQEISELLYGGKLAIEFIGLGILVPVVEEMIFRGLMYRRLREYTPMGPAAVVCSLIFAFYHGNLVQGVYAFCLSLLFIYVYERFHSMAAPVLFHGAANLVSVAVSELGLLDWAYRSAGTFWGMTVLCCGLLILMVYLIERFVHLEELTEKKETGAE